jgi:hypothetical protein
MTGSSSADVRRQVGLPMIDVDGHITSATSWGEGCYLTADQWRAVVFESPVQCISGRTHFSTVLP